MKSRQKIHMKCLKVLAGQALPILSGQAVAKDLYISDMYRCTYALSLISSSTIDSYPSCFFYELEPCLDAGEFRYVSDACIHKSVESQS